MSNRENRSIAYIYNEMDPAEKLEFERDLKRDSNLLIEVESLKKVSGTLKELEQIEPPTHVVEAICKSAKSNAENSQVTYWRPFFYSVAAILLIGMTSGIFLMERENPSEDDNPEESASFSGTPVFSQPVSSSSVKNTTPWVDKNDVIYFQGNMGPHNSSVLDSTINNSFKKLTPVTDPSQLRPFQRQLQLTGSHN